MKRKIYIIIGIIIILVLILLFIKINANDAKEIHNLRDDIIMTIKEGTLTNTGVTLVLTDPSGSNEDFRDYDFEVQRKVGDKWKLVSKIDDYLNVFAGTGYWYELDENNSFEIEVNWSNKYGKLDTGEYRIIISSSKAGSVVAEFTIE